jgi:hypothetical protein
MSEDLIKRSDAIEAIENTDWYHQSKSKDMVSGANSDEHQAWYKADDIYKALNSVPSADRPQGEWIWKEREFNRNYKVKGFDEVGKEYEVFVHEIGTEKVNYCSACGKRGDSRMMNYCPNCGVRMTGADGENA